MQASAITTINRKPITKLRVVQPQIATKVDAVLVESDTLVQYLWKKSASANKKRILILDNTALCFESIARIPLNTPIFIAEELDNQNSSNSLAIELYSRGFQKLYLTTNYLQFRTRVFPWFQRILGKSPPWPIFRSLCAAAL